MPPSPPGSRARAELSGTRFADVRWLGTTDSTNTQVMALARQGEREGIVVVADHQRAGRGRRGRTWEAPPGAALMLTVLLRPRAADLSASIMAVAVAAVDAVEALTGVRPGLKWPNDLVWPGDGTSSDRKLAGMLAEVDWPAQSSIAGGWAQPGANERLVVAAGIGINIDWGDAMPDELASTAVALDAIVAPVKPPEREALLVALLRSLEHWYGGLDRGTGERESGAEGRLALVAAWRDRSATLGRRVRVDLGPDEVVGMAVDITEEGQLVVDRDEGDRIVLAVGDVVHLRPLG